MLLGYNFMSCGLQVKDMNINARAWVLAFSVSVSLQAMSLPGLAAGDLGWSTFYSNGQQAETDSKLDLAEQSYRKALQLARKQTKDPADVDKCLNKLAGVLALRDRTGEAQQLYNELLARTNKKYGADSQQAAAVLIKLGSLQEAAGDHSTAITFYQRSLAINERNYGPYSPAVANNLHGLAKAMCGSGNKIEGEKHYKRAMAILSQDPSLEASKELEVLLKDYNKDLIKGNDDSNQQLIKDFQKDVLDKPAGPSSNAGPVLRPAMSVSAFSRAEDSSARSHDDWQTSDAEKVTLRGFARPMSDTTLDPAYKIMNDTIFKQDHYGKGEDEYQRMIAVDINALGPNHPAVANDLTGLANFYIKQNRFADAAPLLERALGVYDKVYGSNNLMSVNACRTLASAEFRAGNAEKAAAFYRRALTQPSSVNEPNSIETAKVLNELAYLYFAQGKLQDAATFYQWALASTEGAVGKESPLTAACLKDYAQVLRQLGRTDDATQYDNRAQDILAVGSKTAKP